MAFTATFNPSSEGSQIKFMGFDTNGKAGSYTMKVKSAEVASQIVEKLKKEVEEVKKA